MKKGRAVIGLILNLLIVAGVGFAVSNVYFGFWNFPGIQYRAFEYFTVDSNVFLAIAALFMIFVDIAALRGKKVCRFVQVLKLIGVVGTLVTAIITVAYLLPQNVATVEYLYGLEANLWLHAVVPALGLISFIIENQPRMKPWLYAFFGLILPVAYGGVVVTLVKFGYMADPYGFLTIKPEAIWENILWAAGTVVGSYLLGVIVLLFHNIGAAKRQPVEVKEEAPVAQEEIAALPPVNEAKPEETKPEEVKPEEKPAEAEEEAVVKPEPKPEPVTVLAPRTAYAHKIKKPSKARTYHVTKQPSGKWQVKLAGSNKAIKTFDTQREAIAFAKGLVESRGGSYRIHSVKGKIRS